jgi:CHAD domain-containing protein
VDAQLERELTLDVAQGWRLAGALGTVERAATRDGTLTGLLAAYLHEQFQAIVQGDAELRRGADVVHPTRVATRRFRSVLRIFGDLFDEPVAAALDAELAWYAERLGAARDVQVMRAHLLDQVAALSDEVRADGIGAHIRAALDVDEHQARGELLAALASDRYATLLSDAGAFVVDVAALRIGKEKHVARYVQRADRKARRRLRAAAVEPVHDEQMHRARKAAKRARYTAELAVPVLGKRAKRVAKRAKRTQTELGVLQDAVVTAHYLAGIAQADGLVCFGVGVLWQREQERAERARRTGRRFARR